MDMDTEMIEDVIEELVTAKKPGKGKMESVTISPPKFYVATYKVTGTAPFMQAAFPSKIKNILREKMLAGSTAGKGKKREARDFESDFLEAQHISTEGWNGIPASAFRIACIDACRMVGFKMTHAKMSLFAKPDGYDRSDATPLVRLEAGPPEQSEMAVRNATGVVDLRARPIWREWGCTLRVEFDADQFTISDVTNLLARAGIQVGVGEGRPFSKNSAGLGFGTFSVELIEEAKV